MPYASVAIVGRPNVGKSTLFNRLAGSRIAIEAPTSGVTRDRVLIPLTIEDRSFDLVDTGGIGVVDSQSLEDHVHRQIQLAIETASVLIFMVDCRDEVTPLGIDVADYLRRVEKPVILVANKADTNKLETELASFHELGFGDAIAISAKQDRNIEDLEEAILKALPPVEEDEEPTITRDLMKIALVGRRNVGKSSMINMLVGEERVIVSDTPGTTRDSLDIIIERDNEKFVVIDTAGLRKRGQMDDIMEFYGHLRTERAVRRANVVILMLDVMEDISRVDKQIGALVVEEHKPCIVVLNKWDLAVEANPEVTVESFQEYISDRLPGLWFCPLAGLSAKTGMNGWEIIERARELYNQAQQTATTGQINQAISAAQKKRRPKPQHGKTGKMYYATQVNTLPPTFLIFCNNPAGFDDSYKRYLNAHLRKSLGFPDIPLKLIFKTSREKEIGRYT